LGPPWSSAFRYDARPGGGVADPPEDLEYDVVLIGALSVGWVSRSEIFSGKCAGRGIWFFNFQNMGILFFTGVFPLGQKDASCLPLR
jgi:hypothetical protein